MSGEKSQFAFSKNSHRRESSFNPFWKKALNNGSRLPKARRVQKLFNTSFHVFCFIRGVISQVFLILIARTHARWCSDDARFDSICRERNSWITIRRITSKGVLDRTQTCLMKKTWLKLTFLYYLCAHIELEAWNSEFTNWKYPFVFNWQNLRRSSDSSSEIGGFAEINPPNPQSDLKITSS